MAEAKTNAAETKEAKERITIKFGKGLAKPFTAKDGRELMEIRIPNQDPDDKRPWEAFVLPANFVHDNQYGSGLWFKLPEDGTTNLSRSVPVETEKGREWKTETRTVSNSELKALVENYKNRDDRADVKETVGKVEKSPERSAEKRNRVKEKIADLAKETLENIEKRRAEKAKDSKSAGREKTDGPSR